MATHQPIYVIADDLTGTCDTAAQFATSGIRTFSYVLQTAFEGDPLDDNLTAGMICINTNTRTASPELAYKRYYDIGLRLETLQYRRLFKKIDTALRGNIGPEVAGIINSTGAKIALLAPALPHDGRTTVGGRQYIKGVAVEKTSFACDPLNPVRESHLPTLLKPFFGSAVSTVPVEVTRSGNLKELLDEFVIKGIKVAVLDAESSEDLEAGALAIHDRASTIFVGSLSIALALKRHWFAQSVDFRQSGAGRASHFGGCLLLCGSRHERSRAQLEWVRQNLSNEVALFPITADNVRHWLASGRIDQKLLLEIDQAGKECKGILCFIDSSCDWVLNITQIERTIERYLAFLALTVTEMNNINGLAIIGGDTAMSICSELGIGMVEVTGDIGMFAAASIVSKGPLRGLKIVTKGGSVGAISICKDIFHHLAPATRAQQIGSQ